MFVRLDETEFNRSVQSVSAVELVTEFDPSAEAEGREARAKRTKDGLRSWDLTCPYKHEKDFQPEFAIVRITQAEEPEIVVPGPITFGGVAVRTYDMGGKRGWKFAAESWTQERRPSEGRANGNGRAEPVPPPVSPGREAVGAQAKRLA